MIGLIHGYAVLFPSVGYCQGMNFIAGFIILLSDSQEDAFFMFLQLMTVYRLSLYYYEGLPLLKLQTFQFKVLLERMLPEIHRRFDAEGITPELYVTKWILTLFTQTLQQSDNSQVTRLWDLIVSDGIQSSVVLALAKLKVLQG